MFDLNRLETVFGQSVGQWEIPKTYMTAESSHYDPELLAVMLTTTDEQELEHLQFIWLHEAYHHYQYVCLGLDFSEPMREKCGPVAYYGIPSEKAANRFAQRVCVANGWTVPNDFPEGYFT